ncbi:MAG: hypothetical protein KKD63_16645, partial [Proteobacteria bacterium]|nr:hypothetical protein [Pseudomonadota bacterium]
MFRENHYGATDRTLKVFRRAGIVTHEPREHGKQRASVKDFHSFRTTWITLALSAGVPMELVRRVTGHATVDIVLKHYFRPGRDDFRKSLEMHMPRVITGVNAPTVESRGDSLAKALRLLEGVNARNFSERVPEARNLLQQAVALSGQAQMG